MSHPKDLPPELRQLVRLAVALLGSVIQHELGTKSYRMIEEIRQRMTSLRGRDGQTVYRSLHSTLGRLRRLSSDERFCFVHSYTLMLELMNACESAYRTYRLRQAKPAPVGAQPLSIVFVATAHPTEARSPENIAVFHEIQRVLVDALDGSFEDEKQRLRHLLGVAWRLYAARRRKPRVRDEAEHLYSILLRPETLALLLDANVKLSPVFLRSWVGGDKDGHPGVDECALTESLQLARTRLVRFTESCLDEARLTARTVRSNSLLMKLRKTQAATARVRLLRAGDGKRVRALRAAITELAQAYTKEIGELHPAIARLQGLIVIFPALVVPLELRESSDVLMERKPRGAKASPAIVRMVRRVGLFSRGGSPLWYARGFIISMASSIEHIRAAEKLVRRELGGLRLPIIPLFEQREALEQAPAVVTEMLADRGIREAVDRYWQGNFEMMVGYSDSAKESGVLSSRLTISDAMRALDGVVARHHVRPVFFQGSGGSVDRGGGSISEQTAWWPRSALALYKVTVQGEMVERTFASPEIARGQLQKIVGRYAEALSSHKPRRSPEVVHRFAARVGQSYRQQVESPAFLKIIDRGTAYRYLSVLKIGSRPSKRPTAGLNVSGLRAIPWVMCWTQTRVLFPTWWGIGSAWKSATPAERRELKRAFSSDPLFRSFVKLLGFTLAKVELPVWRVYLENSGLARGLIRTTLREFEQELTGARSFVRVMSGNQDLLWFRPWLGTSIRLRSPMIHPLNLVQVLALLEKDANLIRETVTGISSGMMTTG